jgi:CRP-like cAMP-binding protein
MVTQLAELVEFPLHAVLCEAGERPKSVYFPLSNLLSSLIFLDDGTAVETGTIGNEGMADVAVLGAAGEPHHYRLVQRVEGECLRIPASAFRRTLNETTVLRRMLVRYALGMTRQSAQYAACNLHHTVEKRMASWLLSSADRTGRDEFEITQEFLSQALGVRRQTVNATAGQLQEAGVIAYRWGRIQIRDRKALEEMACECYRVNRGTYARLMKKGA